MPVFDYPRRVTVEPGGAASGIGLVLAAVPAVAALAAVVAFAARYALVLAVIVLVSGAVTAGFVWALWRRWTVLVMPGRPHRSRAAASPRAAVSPARRGAISAAPRRLALPSAPPARIPVQQSRTGSRAARRGQ